MPDTNPSSLPFPDPPDPRNQPETSGDSSGDSAHGEAAATDAEARELVLVKHGQRYVFRYVRGEENKMLSGLADLARDPKSDLNWFDAAVLSHQMGKAIGQQLQRLKKSS